MTEVFDYFDVGRRRGAGEGSIIEWRPIGGYVDAQVPSTHGIVPGTFSFSLKDSHPLASIITPVTVQRTAWHFRAGYHGREFTGRFMSVKRPLAAPGADAWVYSGVDYRYHLKRMCCWVNNLFPPEIQIGLTGKQNVKWGPIDMVFKNYVSEVATRLDKPIYVSLPQRWITSYEYQNVADFTNGDDLIAAVQQAADEVILKQARFTMLDDLFQQEIDRLNWGVSVDLWDGTGEPPLVFNTNGVGKLQSIIDYTGDNFLDLSQLSNLGNLWSDRPGQACYVFDTWGIRDMLQVQFRTDADFGIRQWETEGLHSDAVRAIIGGKSPAIVNDLIEIGANLAIQLLIAVLAPGLGLGVVVGDLFDDIFFAYQVYFDNALEDEIGQDDAFAEIFADDTAAWSLDSYSVGKTALAERAGSQSLTVELASGVPGKGWSFGQDDGTARRFQEGDMVTLWDRGNGVERPVTSVVINHKRGSDDFAETVTLGEDKRIAGTFDRIFDGIGRGAAGLRGLANST